LGEADGASHLGDRKAVVLLQVETERCWENVALSADKTLLQPFQIQFSVNFDRMLKVFFITKEVTFVELIENLITESSLVGDTKMQPQRLQAQLSRGHLSTRD